MEHLTATIEHKLNEKYPGRTVKCLPEIDPISFKAFYRVIFEGRKTHFTYQPEVLAEVAKTHSLNVDQVAEQWVHAVHGLEQLMLQNRVEV